ncbi:MAG: hypothetical protein M3466_08530 [Gemmatimonadota bacterium]|nr:hypothetical protein [Gemmatimonadota bacterium]
MAVHLHVFPTAVMLFVITTTALSQQSGSGTSDPRDARNVAAADSGSVATQRTSRPIPRIDVSYDREFDRTIFRVSVPSVSPGTELSVTAKQPGRGTVIPADSVGLFLTHVGSVRKFRKGDDLNLLIDGRSFVIIENLDVSVSKVGGVYVEQASAEVSLADFVAIANATTANAKFGKFSFWLAGGQLDALRAFAIRVGVVPARSR